MGLFDSVVDSVVNSLENQAYYEVFDSKNELMLVINLKGDDFDLYLEDRDSLNGGVDRVLVVENSFSRSLFKVPEGITKGDLETSFSNGVLEVRVEK